MTDVRKAVTASDPSRYKRSSTAARRSGASASKSSRDRERDYQDDHHFDDESDTFPQFWYVQLYHHRFSSRSLQSFFLLSSGFFVVCGGIARLSPNWPRCWSVSARLFNMWCPLAGFPFRVFRSNPMIWACRSSAERPLPAQRA